MTGALPPPPPALAAARAAVPAPPSDPLVRRQRFLAQIGWTPPAATGPRPLVAVLDTGVDASDPDLRDVVVAAGARAFVQGADPLRDPSGHGTHVAGIIAATAGNGVGGAGVARARILPVTIADARGRATTSALVRGLRYASARGARVINISFGGSGFSRPEQDAIDAAVRRGALVVAPAGNTGARPGPPEYPGAYRHVLTVGALGRDGRVLPLSDRGPQVAIAAPGERVASTRPGGGGLVARTGTSMAAAVVSGAAARVLDGRPSLSAAQVRAVLEASARDLPPSGPDPGSGAGALDLAAALAAPSPLPEDPEPNDDPPQAAATRPLLRVGEASGTVRGRTGSFDDPRDGFRVALRAGEGVSVRLAPEGATTADLDLALWRPGTPAGARTPAFSRAWLVAASLRPGATESLDLTAPADGVYTLEVQGLRGATAYLLRVDRVATAVSRTTPDGAEGP